MHESSLHHLRDIYNTGKTTSIKMDIIFTSYLIVNVDHTRILVTSTFVSVFNHVFTIWCLFCQCVISYSYYLELSFTIALYHIHSFWCSFCNGTIWIKAQMKNFPNVC